MYDELVKRLRICPDYNDGCVNCLHEHDLGCRTTTMREAADAIEELSRENGSLAKTAQEAGGALRQRRPVVRGKWEDVEVTYVADKTTLPFERISSMRCNQCNRYHTEIYYYGNPTEMAHFCPNCGADMREVRADV